MSLCAGLGWQGTAHNLCSRRVGWGGARGAAQRWGTGQCLAHGSSQNISLSPWGRLLIFAQTLPQGRGVGHSTGRFGAGGALWREHGVGGTPDVPLPSTAAAFPKPPFPAPGLQPLLLSKAGPLPSLTLDLSHKERRWGSSSKTSRCDTSQQPWADSVAPGPLVLVLPSTPGSPATPWTHLGLGNASHGPHHARDVLGWRCLLCAARSAGLLS